MKRLSPRLVLVSALAALLAAPLLGGILKGLPGGFASFPPLIHAEPFHAPFVPWVWAIFAALGLAVTFVLVAPSRAGFHPGTRTPPALPSVFPAWGWFGMILLLVAWICAWGRFDWLGPFRQHTFFPLWLGYILTVDGLVHRRCGTSYLRRAPGEFLLLFPASALSWWYFEYLNRFVQNWWYHGAFDFTPLHYVLHATLCFSTVLPSIFETRDLLLTLDHFSGSFRHGSVVLPGLAGKLRTAFAAGAAGLFVMAAFPEPAFYLVWLAPLVVLHAALRLAGHAHPLGRIDEGDWTDFVALAVGALVCGFFWELWNYWSLPKWRYDVPYVTRFPVFEMPVVGFAGYLPFGPLCWLFWLAWKRLVTGRAGEGVLDEE